MSTVYTELVIKAPFLLVKGFLLGYLQGQNTTFPYFFHRKAGIRRETLGDLVRELLDLDCHTHLCVPEEKLPEFVAALGNVQEVIPMTVESQRRIKSAHSHFSFHLYDENMSAACKDVFHRLPEGVHLEKFNPVESREDLARITDYGKINPYAFEASGEVVGDFDGVMQMYLAIKRCTLHGSILCSEIRLELEK